MSRSLLHRTKIGEFKAYLSDSGIEFRDGRGDYQVIQVLVGKDWMCIYDRSKGDHFTVDARMEGLVKRFIDNTAKQNKCEKVIVSTGCHDCIFLYKYDNGDWSCLVKKLLDCTAYRKIGGRHPKCPLLTQDIKVVTE